MILESEREGRVDRFNLGFLVFGLNLNLELD